MKKRKKRKEGRRKTYNNKIKVRDSLRRFKFKYLMIGIQIIYLKSFIFIGKFLELNLEFFN